MIISQEQEVVFGSANQQATAFGIENNAKAFILLSDKLYTNKPYAIVRELSTNCLDAHKLNGQTRPFEVKVPTRLDPRFVIRDFGPGLSDVQIRGADGKPGLYNTYFASTKSDSNDFIGAMGLGSKSPFSYTKTFTIVSCHNGRKMGYTAIMKNLGPEIIPLFNEPMGEDDVTGIEITVPVKTDDISKWETEIKRTFRTFAGVEPKILGSKVEINYFPEFTPEKQWFSLDSSPFENDQSLYAVYGRIVYPIKMSEIPDIKADWLLNRYGRVYVHFDLGELDITPSREELSYNEETIENIRNKVNNLENITLAADLERFQTIENKRQLSRELQELNHRQRTILGTRSILIQDKPYQDWVSMFHYSKVENLVYNANMVAYYVGSDAERKRISSSWNVRNRISAQSLFSINNKKVVFMIDDKPSRRASTIRGMYALDIHKYCYVILVNPDNEKEVHVMNEITKLFEGDEVIKFKCSDMEPARVKDAELNASNSDKEGAKRPKSPNIHKWTKTDGKWEVDSFCMSANEVRELEGYAIGISRDSIVEFPSGNETSFDQTNIKGACDYVNVSEFWMIRPAAMKYAQDAALDPLMDEFINKFIELIDKVDADVIPPSTTSRRQINNILSIKALTPLIKNFYDVKDWESSVELNQFVKSFNGSIHGSGENADKLALCQKIYNRLVETAKSDFETKAEEFEEKYPVIWYMLDEYYIHEAKNHNDLAKIAALLGAI
ncbi:RIIA lysis inhibitor [Citrobacter phage Moon]|uniref:RIIA protein n=2 Tax=Moonvirus TaxID=1985329 RepID=A0A2H4YFU0_9CAUD|nr:RIIA lysis inhibitor [Citrobacter phage Moon]YP_009618060.1 RIIA lysis inhibitor [Citrobacter phage CF1 ERZ-2017]AIX11972.1 rIIa [Citrobacter phage Moon]AUE22874.1 rIIA protein [Citrobacter phage CF1 ERZ-2017]